MIAEAAVRLVADRKGLGDSIRREFRSAIKEAVAEGGFFDAVDRDTDETGKKVSSKWRKIFTGLRDSLGSIFSGAALVGKFLLIGTAAAGAVAGVVQLGVAVGALGAAVVQAAGVAGLLPAALAAYLTVSGAIKIATAGMGDALSAAATGSLDEFNTAIEDLSPSAKEFAKSVRAIKPALDSIKLETQEALFSALGDVIKPLSETYLPIFGDTFKSIAADVGGAGRDVAEFMLQAAQVQKVGTFTANVKEAFSGLRGAIVPATSALLDIVTTGSTFLPRLTAAVTKFSEGFAEKISAMAADGRLEAFFDRAIEALKTLGRIAGNVFEGLGNVMDAATAASGGLLENIESITQRFADWTGSSAGQEALISFFKSIKQIVDALAPAFFALLQVIGTSVMPILADLARAIGPVLVPIFEAFGQLLTALRPLISALAKAFSAVLAAFEPVIDAFTRAFQDAMPQLLPIIKDIGDAFANLVESMAPLAPVFVDLLLALLPIIPPLIQMVADLMPQLIDLIKAIMPYVKAWAEMMITLIPIFVDIVSVILAILIPVLQFVATVLGWLLGVFTWAIGGIWDLIKTVFGAIADFVVWVWNGIGDFISGALDWIGDLFSDGIGGLVGKVGQWFMDIWNNIMSWMASIASGVGDAIGNVVNFFTSLPGKIWDAVKGAAKWLYETGRDIIQGLINGIKDMIGNLIASITGAVQGSISTAKKGFGVRSPSTVFRDIGINLGLGLIQGIDSMVPAVADALGGLTAAGAGAPNVSGMFGTGGGAGAGGAGGGPTVVNQTNMMQPGTDVKQFSDLVLGRSMGDFLSAASTLSVARNGVQAGVNDQWVGV